MKIVYGWKNVDPEFRGASLALGEFDGVHKGHLGVIVSAARAAADLKIPLAVISFEPHPRRWFEPDAPPFRLMNMAQQARALEDLGVDIFYILEFDAALAAMSDEEFVRNVLVDGLGVKHTAAGFDITFGKGRTGDPERLRGYGDKYGFSVSVVDCIGDYASEKYSSSEVRNALQSGQPERAAQVLGRPFAIEGVVVEGQHLGRKLGYPTANVDATEYVRPKFGVYATRSRLPDGREIPGVANFGENPTTGLVEARLEVYLFDFDEDIYGQTIETDLIWFLRPELNFDGLEALVEQIGKDAREARRRLMPPF